MRKVVRQAYQTQEMNGTTSVDISMMVAENYNKIGV